MEKFKARLQEVKAQMLAGTLDEIPLDARPKMVDFDFDKDSFVVVSYSRKDFEEVYLFLEYLYRAGCRFWYDAGMLGTDTWIKEFQDKYENPNCLGTLTFFSDNYVSDSTKAELDIVFDGDQYRKQNMMISLVGLADMTPDMVLIKALTAGRITIENAAAVKPVLTTLIQAEKERTIHRYSGEEDIPALADKLEQIFSVQDALPAETWSKKDFAIVDGCLYKYLGTDAMVTIPGVVHTIGDGAFRDCATITQVVLPNSVKKIGAFAFCDCKAMVDVAIPEGVTGIGRAAFGRCSSLTHIVVPDSLKTMETNVFQNCTALKTVSLSKNITKIPKWTFLQCTALTDIAIPAGVTSIGGDAFKGCSSLTHIVVPDSVKMIGENVFSWCKSLETVSLSKSIMEIPKKAFSCCTALTDVVIPDSVTSIGAGAFSSCYSLTRITIPDSVKELGMSVFSDCTALKTVSLSKNITAIPVWVFRGCKALTDVEIPDGVTIVGGHAFSSCSSLTQITYQGTMQQWEQVRFGAQTDCPLKRIQCIDGVVELNL